MAARAGIEDPTPVSVRGLVPGSSVVLTASTTDEEGVRWTSEARFAVPGTGTVTTSDRSEGGSWTGVQPMGLFTDMAHRGAPSDEALLNGGRHFTVDLTASSDGSVLASASTERLFPADLGVTSTSFTVAGNGVDGTYFAPSRPIAGAPAVLLFGGSEGGLSQTFGAETLAAEGYPTLTIAYFRGPGLPSALSDVPIEYFERAGRLLQTQSGVTPGHVVVWGISRGSEAAVLAAADDPAVFDSVVAAVPNDRVGSSTTNPSGAAWTLHGRPLLPPRTLGDDPDPADDPSTFLPAAHVRGPLLTICGGTDQIWDSCQHAEGLHTARGSGIARATDVHLDYPRAGHLVGWAWRYFSTTTVDLTQGYGTAASGGTVQDNLLAMAEARTRVLAFLRTLTRSQTGRERSSADSISG